MNARLPLSCLAVALASLCIVAPAHAARTLECKLHYNLAGWSVFYKTASGSGTVTCDNGQSLAVKISAKGGGLTFGKSKIEDGTGKFAGVERINDVLGTYVSAEAHAGAVKSSKATAMTKGDVSLALAGTGKGFDIGIGFGKFVLEAR
ncbi:MAG TPA: hypothetical protein VL118_09875 [Luteimonas sp.]|jgi:hypothetical protein|nr:hypothetical protein [Luteimonas sp.]